MCLWCPQAAAAEREEPAQFWRGHPGPSEVDGVLHVRCVWRALLVLVLVLVLVRELPLVIV